MAKTQYETTPDSALTSPAGFAPSPLTGAEITSRGTESKPVPPAPVRFTKKLNPAPTLVKAPGGEGTI